MEESMTALLLQHAPLSALVSSRVYWVRAPQGVLSPFVTLQVISGMPDVRHAGPSGFITTRVQADCYGLSYATAKSTARAVTDRLSGYRGTQGATIFDGIFKDAERDFFEDSATPEKLFRVSMDFFLQHKGV